ncbi:hypothetical protein V6N11_038115 [Hibiscus sabdariffa]|uniref:Uncharacterized protein n=2 Tax=Hibiscus sabdariffa TaxID=183260 RepID=A0ABR1ZQQ8_9ROSI
MDSLLGLLQKDDKNVMTAVVQGVIPVLVRLLDSSCLEMKEKMVAAISRVSCGSSKHVLIALIAEGLLLLNHLLRVLESHLASCPLTADALIVGGFIPLLEDTLSCGVLAIRIVAARAVYELALTRK